MKTLTATLALLFTVTVTMAYSTSSILTVEVLGHRANTLVVIDGKKYNPSNNVVMLNGLMPGNYPVQLLRPTSWGDQGVVFNGVIRIPQRSNVTASITPRGMNVSAQPLAHAGGSYWDANNGHGHGATVRPNPNGNGGFVSILSTEPRPVAPVIIGMHPHVFESALRSIEMQSFDSDQIRVAKQVISQNGASAQQIAEIMKLVSFESSRLEIAKYGYKFVADPENYFLLNDLFWFSSSVRELDHFIYRY